MRARMKSTGRGWRTVKLSVKARRHEGHHRAIVTVTQKGGTRYTLELNRGHAFQLANTIVDALETESDAT